MSDTIFSKKQKTKCYPSPHKHLNHLSIRFATIYSCYFGLFSRFTFKPIHENTSSLCVARAITDFTCVMLCDDKLRMVSHSTKCQQKKSEFCTLSLSRSIHFLTLPLFHCAWDNHLTCVMTVNEPSSERHFDSKQHVYTVVKVPVLVDWSHSMCFG